jgi:hypothetical protein
VNVVYKSPTSIISTTVLATRLQVQVMLTFMEVCSENDVKVCLLSTVYASVTVWGSAGTERTDTVGCRSGRGALTFRPQVQLCFLSLRSLRICSSLNHQLTAVSSFCALDRQ